MAHVQTGWAEDKNNSITALKHLQQSKIFLYLGWIAQHVISGNYLGFRDSGSEKNHNSNSCLQEHSLFFFFMPANDESF